eukprot:GHUV01054487.1.p1 GENE.GHUV01054487.1~~GHUV01054487.1.p1  ORF type:complete len:110 (+),score=22.09 GHUV01054487.1:142-471(+)
MVAYPYCQPLYAAAPASDYKVLSLEKASAAGCCVLPTWADHYSPCQLSVSAAGFCHAEAGLRSKRLYKRLTQQAAVHFLHGLITAVLPAVNERCWTLSCCQTSISLAMP